MTRPQSPHCRRSRSHYQVSIQNKVLTKSEGNLEWMDGRGRQFTSVVGVTVCTTNLFLRHFLQEEATRILEQPLRELYEVGELLWILCLSLRCPPPLPIQNLRGLFSASGSTDWTQLSILPRNCFWLKTDTLARFMMSHLKSIPLYRFCSIYITYIMYKYYSLKLILIIFK